MKSGLRPEKFVRLRLLMPVLVGVGLFLGFAIQSAQAQIAIEVDRQFTLSKQGVMNVVETEELTNKFKDRYLPGGSEREYYFVISTQESAARQQVAEAIYKSTTVLVNGETTSFERFRQGDVYGIKYKLKRRLNPSERQSVRIQYNHPELGEKIGGLVDAYIPAFADEFDFDLENTNYTYRTTLRIPSDTGDENIVSVEPLSKFREGEFDVYVFDQESLVGKFVWVQRGSQQTYHFKITQTILPTQERNTGNINEYKMIIPRDMVEARVEQKVYFTKIDPEPHALEVDNEGNILGIFRLSAHREHKIVLEGYATLHNRKDAPDIAESGSLENISRQEFARYLQPAEYWEVNAGSIDERAEQIVGSEDDVYKIVTGVYNSVVNSIDYSEVKRFGLNERQGALATLEGGAAVCMEYSDLYLTLLRNRGVPARAVFGYGYDSRLSSDSQEPHQWVQVYLPRQGEWMSVDVTWGEAGPQVIGGDLNHFFTHVAAENPNTPSVLSRLAIGSVEAELLGPKLEIEVLSELPRAAEEAKTQEELLATYPEYSDSQRDYYADVFASKYRATLEHLVTDPARIDAQGWFLVALTAVLVLAVATVAVKTAQKLLGRRQARLLNSGVISS